MSSTCICSARGCTGCLGCDGCECTMESVVKAYNDLKDKYEELLGKKAMCAMVGHVYQRTITDAPSPECLSCKQPRNTYTYIHPNPGELY
jgi:hypothetical protein